MTDVVVPPIPVTLMHRPTVGGLVKPYVNVELADGGVDFRSTHHKRWERCWREGICQVCALGLTEPIVLLGGPLQLETYFSEPPLHPWCAGYASKACPMVAGRMSHYPERPKVSDGKRGKKCPLPGCDCQGWLPHPGQGNADHGGEPAHEWFAVWADAVTLAVNPHGRLLGGIPSGVRRTRQVSTPVAAVD